MVAQLNGNRDSKSHPYVQLGYVVHHMHISLMDFRIFQFFNPVCKFILFLLLVAKIVVMFITFSFHVFQ
jgi:hypothetical protein